MTMEFPLSANVIVGSFPMSLVCIDCKVSSSAWLACLEFVLFWLFTFIR